MLVLSNNRPKKILASKYESFIVWDSNIAPSAIKKCSTVRNPAFSSRLNHFCIVIKNFPLTIKTSLNLWDKTLVCDHSSESY